MPLLLQVKSKSSLLFERVKVFEVTNRGPLRPWADLMPVLKAFATENADIRYPIDKELHMKKKELATLLESVSVEDLKSLVSQKEKFTPLEKKRKELEKQLASVNREIRSLQDSLGKIAGRGPGRPKGTTKKKMVRKTRKRIRQPSLSSLIVEILKEKKRSLGVNELCDVLLTQKGYKTRAKNFKSQVRILLYKNEKGLFRKTGPGKFALAAERKQTVKKKRRAKRKVVAKKKTSKRKK